MLAVQGMDLATSSSCIKIYQHMKLWEANMRWKYITYVSTWEPSSKLYAALYTNRANILNSRGLEIDRYILLSSALGFNSIQMK